MPPEGGTTSGGTTNARALFELWTPWAKGIGFKLSKGLGWDTQEALGNAALMGLWQACERFDASRGWKFRTFAQRRVVGAIRDAQRRESGFVDTRIRQQWADRGEPLPGDIALEGLKDAQHEEVVRLADKKALDPARVAEAKDELRAVVASVPAGARRTIVEKYFIEDESMKAAAAAVGLSESRGCQIIQEAREGLARRMKVAGVVLPKVTRGPDTLKTMDRLYGTLI